MKAFFLFLFKKATLAAVTNPSGSKSRLANQSGGSVHDLTFHNLVIGSAPLVLHLRAK